MYRILMVLILVFNSELGLMAQFTGGKLALDKIIPPAPEAAALAKYGQIPVSLNTGTINVDVPIYTIDIGSFKLPISLSYHGSGVKVDDVATSVGLGWTLNAGGLITRTVIGLADDMSGNGTTTGGYVVNNNSYVDKDAADIQTSQNDLFFLRFAAIEKIVDTEPDMFFYNFGSQAGKFIFNRNKQAVTIPYSNMKIEYGIGGGIFQYFRIIDDQGMIYEFNILSYTDSFYKQYEELSNSFNLLTQTEIFNGVTNWYLSRIITPSLKDTIKFVYEPQHNYLRTEIKDYYAEEGFKMSPVSETFMDYFTKGRFPRSMQSNTTEQKLIKEITFPNGKVTFNYAYDRTDLSSGTDSDGYMGRLSGATIYSLNNPGSSYMPVKNFSFVQDYFVSTGASQTHRNYRLRLKEVIENDRDNVKIGNYKFEYEDGLPYRSSYAQDLWGFYNEQNNNTGLLPKQLVSSYVYPSRIEEIGTANREPSGGFMTAGILKKITYPTGGHSEFVFEPNQYQTEELEMTTKTERIEVTTGITAPRDTLVFTNMAETHAGQLTITISKYSDKMADRSPYVAIRDLTASGNPVTYFESSDSSNNFSLSIPFTFIYYHQYEISIYTHRDNPPGVNVSITATHNDILQGVKKTRLLGGVRIGSITHYDNNKAVLKEIYKYGNNEDGFGIPIIDIASLKVTKRPVTFIYGKPPNPGSPPGPGNCLATGKAGMQYYANPVVPLSTLNGSLIGYDIVSKYLVDPADNSKATGRETFSYLIVPDHVYNVPNEPGAYIVDTNPWKNGLLLGSSKSNFSVGGGESTSLQYDILKKTDVSVLKVNNRYISLGGCTPIDTRNDYQIYNYPVSLGIMLPVKKTTVTTAPLDNNNTSFRNLTTVETFQYKNLSHFQPTKHAVTTSRGDSIEASMLYPDDMIKSGMDNEGVYNKMITKNMNAVVVEKKEVRRGNVLNQFNVKFKDWYNDGQVLAPQSAENIITNDLSTSEKIVYYNYDRKGHPTSLSKEGDVIRSYIYDYSEMLPIAEIINASANDIAFTSFETSLTGNWVLPLVVKDTINSITGRSSIDLLKTGSVGITKSGLTTANEYKVSYWTKNNQAFTIAGTQGVAFKGKSLNGWTYFEHRITGVGSVKITGSGLIDELRLYPVNAQMHTYTYEPLNGLTSLCDANSNIAYYEYGKHGKLYVIRDQNGKILKQYDYQYQAPLQQ